MLVAVGEAVSADLVVVSLPFVCSSSCSLKLADELLWLADCVVNAIDVEDGGDFDAALVDYSTKR